ncbi:MBL fold metallo-hydrolase [Pseudonocardia xinjiangensis]|uniref:MBL fold metallo-hydrolase n=1 Tax=Pseudonocardia xinjiangensis TaxID=75289 RepID=UPI003D8ADF30
MDTDSRDSEVRNTPDPSTPGGFGIGPAYQVGRVRAHRIVEWNGQLFTRGQVFADVDRVEWAAQKSWLEPRFWSSETDGVTLTIQSFLLEYEGTRILIDTGIGNGKDRPAVPPFHQLDTPFLDQLATAGAAPEDVDIVVLTHLHSDHVGWNTRFDGHSWVPTFPNARYLIPRTEFDFWNPDGGPNQGSADEDQALVFADSIAPVVAAGQAELWEGPLTLTTGTDLAISLDVVPGHTPGSAVLTVSSGSDSAMFVGDLLSTPMMVGHPDMCAKFGDHWVDDNLDQVRAARRDLLGRAVRLGARLVPAHFNTDAGIFVSRDTTGFAMSDGVRPSHT